MSAGAAPLDPKFLAGIRAGLDGAFDRAAVESYDPASDRIVVFSDHHKGAGNKADDFRRCVHAYTAALGYYLEAGYRLFVLGDAEELWEESPGAVIEKYGDVLALEAEFRSRGGIERFWGNHDDAWRSGWQVRRHLRRYFGDLEVREALRLEVRRPGAGAGAPAAGGTLFFAHGHQGTSESDRFSFLARLPVRWVWRNVQRKTGWSATTPATDHALRAAHDRAMFEWARGRRPGVVLFAGHTHRPVFASGKPDPPPTRPTEDLEAALAAATAAGDRARAAAVRVELEYARTAARRPDEAVTVEPPCYFNSGCCSFPDGDVTGLEIADGEIRLVRWPANLRELERDAAGDLDVAAHVLDRVELEQVLDAVAAPPDAGAGVQEHRIRPAGATIPEESGRFRREARAAEVEPARPR